MSVIQPVLAMNANDHPKVKLTWASEGKHQKGRPEKRPGEKQYGGPKGVQVGFKAWCDARVCVKDQETRGDIAKPYFLDL